VARAAVGPAGLVAAGVGVVIGVLAGLPWEGVVAVAVGTWLLRMAAFAANTGRRALLRETPEMIDPYAVPEPWRGMVRQVVADRDRFAETVRGWPPGPMHDRLVDLDGRVAVSAQQAFQVAKQAAVLEATARLADPDAIGRELQEVQRQRAQHLPGAGSASATPEASTSQGAGPAAELDRREEALAARLQSARRMEMTAGEAGDRLRVLVAQLDHAVSAVVELSFRSAEEPAALPLVGSLEGLVQELNALHLAVGEASQADRSPATPVERRTS
jgi:hypothetical protein